MTSAEKGFCVVRCVRKGLRKGGEGITYGRCRLREALLDEAVDDRADLARAVAQRPAVLGLHIDEDTREQQHEHVVHLLLGEHPARVRRRLQVDAEL